MSVTVLLVACSDDGSSQEAPATADADGGTSGTGGTDSTGPGEVGTSGATVTPIDPGVEVKKGSADFVAITATTEVAAGDVVRTDGTGFAEIVYPDGSITRLDVDTEFQVVSITDDAGTATTRAELESGRVWNRVQDLGSEGEFSIDTSVGVATVRGTAWVADCRDGEEGDPGDPGDDGTTSTTGEAGGTGDEADCEFTVLEGEVEVAPTNGAPVGLTAPFTVTTNGSSTSSPTPVPFDEAFADLWLLENALRDTEAGFPSPDEMYEPFGPLLASFDGQYDGSGAIGPVEQCAPPADCSSPVGSAYTFEYVFSVDCDGFMNCVRSVDMKYTKRGVTAEERSTVTFVGFGYRWAVNLGGNGCTAANPGEVVFTLTPLTAVKLDGIWVIVDVRLEAVATPGRNCNPPTTTTTTPAPTTAPDEPDVLEQCQLDPDEIVPSFSDVVAFGGPPIEEGEDCVPDECEYNEGNPLDPYDDCASQFCLINGEQFVCADVCEIYGDLILCDNLCFDGEVYYDCSEEYCEYYCDESIGSQRLGLRRDAVDVRRSPPAALGALPLSVRRMRS